jgi:PDZ domain
MNASVWRVLMLTFIGVGLMFAAFWWAIEKPTGDFGLTASTRSLSGGTSLVTAVDPDSAAAKAGIRVGDRILPHDNLRDVLTANHPDVGDALPEAVERDGLTRTVTLIAGAGSLDFPLLLVVERVVLLLVAALVAWRRPEDPAARNLAAFLASFGFAIGLNNHNFLNPAVSYVVLTLGSLTGLLYGSAALTRFSGNFPHPARGVRSTLSRIATVASSLAIVASVILGGLSVAYGLSFPIFGIIGGTLLFCIVAAIANFTISYRQAIGADRQRILWVLLTFAVGFSVSLVHYAAIAAGHFYVALDQLSLVTLLALPIGLAYVILKHRLLDFGFVLNRAAVFAGVSVVLVAAFILMEALIANYVATQSHVTGQVLSLAVPLVLGFSMRFVHARVDRFMDDVFFRHRHEAEATIRRFAREAMLVTNERALFDNTVSVVAQNTTATSVAILVVAPEGDFVYVRPSELLGTCISQNDPAFLSMRTWHERVELHALSGALPGEYAFPFIVRGQVAGALICGLKLGGEPYAPDELDALGQMAHGVGLAYDALEFAALKTEIARIAGSENSIARVEERFHPHASAGTLDAPATA